MDSLYLQAKDSALTNQAFSKTILTKIMPQAPDSLTRHEWLYIYALTCFNANQLDTAYQLCRKILVFCPKEKPSARKNELVAITENLLGNYYTYMFVPDSSIYYYENSLSNFRLLPDQSTVPNVYINLADAHIRKSDYAKGVFYYRRALIISDSLQMTAQFDFPVYAGLAQAYMDLRDYENADVYWEKAEKTLSKRSLQEQFYFCNNRGNFYYYQEQYAESLPWSRKALALVLPGHYTYSIGLCYMNLADLYLNLNELDSANAYVEKCQSIFPDLDNPSTRHYLTTIQAGIALKRNDLTQAKKLLAEKGDSKNVEQNLVSIRHRYLELFYAKTGDFKQAYFYLSKNTALNDSLRHERAIKLAATYDMQYKLDTTLISRNVLIANQTREVSMLRQQRLYLFAVGFLVLVMAFLFYFFIRKKQDLQRLEYSSKLNRLRMQNIRNRISPHFVFNALNGIQNTGNSSERKDLLTLLLRKSLEMTEETSISLKDELSFVQTYIQLEEFNLGNDFLLTWEMDPLVNAEKIRLPSMIIQIPVENAIKHALKPKSGEKCLLISINKLPEGISVLVRDNGQGYHPSSSNKTRGTGTGMKVLMQSIQLLNEKNTHKIRFDIKNVTEEGQSGAMAEIFIPDNLHFNI